MRKLALFVSGTLLMASNAMAGTAALNPTALAKSILNVHNAHVSDKGSFAIVYGGEDISHGSHGSTNPQFTHPLLG